MDFFSWFNLPYLGAVIDFALLTIRLLLPILAMIIVFQCFSSMRRHRRDENALIMLVNNSTGEGTPVLYWENSLGRSKGNDIVIADEGLELAKFLYDDGSNMYEILPFDALQKEAKDNSYKKVVNLLNKMR